MIIGGSECLVFTNPSPHCHTVPKDRFFAMLLLFFRYFQVQMLSLWHIIRQKLTSCVQEKGKSYLSPMYLPLAVLKIYPWSIPLISLWHAHPFLKSESFDALETTGPFNMIYKIDRLSGEDFAHLLFCLSNINFCFNINRLIVWKILHPVLTEKLLVTWLTHETW